MEKSVKEIGLWKYADKIGARAMYAAGTRNKDKEVRDQFNADSEVAGTKAWAICMALGMVSASYSDAMCDEIMVALSK